MSVRATDSSVWSSHAGLRQMVIIRSTSPRLRVRVRVRVINRGLELRKEDISM